MGDRVEQLLKVAGPQSSPGTAGAEELAALRLEAANERFEEQRPLVSFLDRRASDAGISTIRSRADLVPLLFAHSSYKSYPESFLANQRWDRMNAWLETISTPRATKVDVSGVADADEWIARLDAAGIHLIVSSGTTGKHSFLPMTDEDMAFGGGIAVAPDDLRYPISYLGPSNAPMRVAHSFKRLVAASGRPGAIHSLEEPMRVADSLRTSALRKKMADGTALPSEVAAFEAENADQIEARQRDLAELVDLVLAHRDEPQIILGGWGLFWRMMQMAQAKGLTEHVFHPDTVVTIAGGLKGLNVPDDYAEQMARFLGPINRPNAYGMSELSGAARECSYGVYHWPTWIELLMVDESGEQLLAPGADGTVRGRLAAYDPAWSGIWGGVISGDQVTASYDPCPCGEPGPTIAQDVVRYSELSGAGDDKLTCGGTIEAYIRGAVGE